MTMFSLFQWLQLPGGHEIVGPIDPYSARFGGRLYTLAYGPLGAIISVFIPIILTIAGILTFAWLIIGGFRLLFSGGDPKNIAGARDNITFALIGFAIVFAAWWLTLIVTKALGLCILGIPLVPDPGDFGAQCL